MWGKPYLQVITDVYVKTAVLEICFEKRYKESVVETFTFAGFYQKNFEKTLFQKIATGKFISKSLSRQISLPFF